MMKNPTNVSLGLIILLLIVVFSTPSHAEEVIIIGEINDTQQLVDSKEYQIYEIDDNEVGDILVTDYISVKVKVWGNLRTKDDTKIITVIKFEVFSD